MQKGKSGAIASFVAGVCHNRGQSSVFCAGFTPTTVCYIHLENIFQTGCLGELNGCKDLFLCQVRTRQ